MAWCNLLYIIGFLLFIFILYKIVDTLIRIPRVGRYQDRYVLITGCANGFGYEAVKRLEKLGCHVFAGCRREESVRQLKETFSDLVDPIHMDITDRESVRKAFDYVSSRLPKETGLWGLVNNAGIYHLLPMELETIPAYKKMLECNLYGAIDVTMTFLPLVKKARGRVVNVSSDSGRNTLPLNVAYSVSKYGLEAFSDGLRRSIRCFDCRAVLVEPGGYKTNIFINSDDFRRSIDTAWDSISEDMRKCIGEDFPNKAKERLVKAIEEYPLSEKIWEVIDAYEHALFGLIPRARYLVGTDAKLLVLLQSLPEWISDAILTSFAVPNLYN